MVNLFLKAQKQKIEKFNDAKHHNIAINGKDGTKYFKMIKTS